MSKNKENTLLKLFSLEERKAWEFQKTEELANTAYNKRLEDFINSDLFDKEAVGKDISNKEFIENEMWFEVRGL